MNIPFNPQDLLFGLVPLVIAGLVRPTWDRWLKFTAAIGVCVAAAIVQTALLGQFDFHSLGVTGVKIFLIVTTTYAAAWKKFQPASALLDYIEANINGGPKPTTVVPFPDIDAGGPGQGQ